jgi:hypothetical protein
MEPDTPVTQPSYQYEIVFFGDYDSTVLDSSNVPDAMDTEFRDQVNGKVQQIKMIFSFQRGINKMSVKLEYNNIIYLITLHRQ